MSAKVYLVGAGPGAPDLLTLRAVRLLESADAVFYDALVNPDIVALATRAEKLAVGKRCGRLSTAQRFINKQLVAAASRHEVIVRLKGGDPSLFGRAQEEISALSAAGIPWEVVPGITAASAASADLGVSLTRRGLARSVTFATPRTGQGEPPGDWVRPVLAAETAVIYMGIGQAHAIMRELVAAGMAPNTPLAVVENASLPGSRKLHGWLADLPRLASQFTGDPALILVGEVYRASITKETVENERATA